MGLKTKVSSAAVHLWGLGSSHSKFIDPMPDLGLDYRTM